MTSYMGRLGPSFPGASPTFLNLTRAFLTFWKEYKDIAHAEPRVALQVLLLGFINEHKKRFFPTSNLRTPVSYMVFAGPQREVLSVFGDGIDVEDFFRSNPLLVHTANPLKGSGCLLRTIVGFAVWVSLFVCWYVSRNSVQAASLDALSEDKIAGPVEPMTERIDTDRYSRRWIRDPVQCLLKQ